jgi:hypothetical protein
MNEATVICPPSYVGISLSKACLTRSEVSQAVHASRSNDTFSARFGPTNDLAVARGGKVGANSFGGTILCADTDQKYWSFGSGNSFRQKADESSVDSLLGPNLAWNSSQLIS